MNLYFVGMYMVLWLGTVLLSRDMSLWKEKGRSKSKNAEKIKL